MAFFGSSYCFYLQYSPVGYSLGHAGRVSLISFTNQWTPSKSSLLLNDPHCARDPITSAKGNCWGIDHRHEGHHLGQGLNQGLSELKAWAATAWAKNTAHCSVRCNKLLSSVDCYRGTHNTYLLEGYLCMFQSTSMIFWTQRSPGHLQASPAAPVKPLLVAKFLCLLEPLAHPPYVRED